VAHERGFIGPLRVISSTPFVFVLEMARCEARDAEGTFRRPE
jgi:hypothetical protein